MRSKILVNIVRAGTRPKGPRVDRHNARLLAKLAQRRGMEARR